MISVSCVRDRERERERKVRPLAVSISLALVQEELHDVIQRPRTFDRLKANDDAIWQFQGNISCVKWIFHHFFLVTAVMEIKQRVQLSIAGHPLPCDSD